MKKSTIAKPLRYFARSVLLLVTSFWFVFALLSGSGEAGRRTERNFAELSERFAMAAFACSCLRCVEMGNSGRNSHCADGLVYDFRV